MMRKQSIIIVTILLCLFSLACRETYLQSINFYMTQRDWKKAEEELLKLLQKEPENGEIHFLLGDVMAHQNDYQKMSEYFTLSLRLSNRFLYKINYLTNRYRIENYNAGVLLHAEKKYSEAIEKFNHSITIAPDNAEAFIQIAHIYLEQEDFEKAIQYYTKAIELNKKDVISRNNLSWIYFKQQNYPKTIEVCKDILKVDGKHVDSIQRLAYCYDLLNEHQNAIKWYQRAIDLSPRETKLYNNLGILFYEMQDFTGAIMQFQKALKIDSTSINIYNYLGDSYRKINDFDNTIKCYSYLVELRPEDQNAWKNLIAAYGNLGLKNKVDEALEKLEQLQK